MFSFANDQFITPWFTISDGQGRVLNSIVFTFTYAGSKVVGLKWRLDCASLFPTGAPRTRSHADRAGGCCRVGQARTPADNDGGHHGRVLPSLAVIYTWEEQSALDATWAVNILFLLAMLASAGLITYILTLGDSSAEYLAAMYAPGGARARALGLLSPLTRGGRAR